MTYPELTDRILDYLLRHSTNNTPQVIADALKTDAETVDAVLHEMKLNDYLGFENSKSGSIFWILPTHQSWARNWLRNGGYSKEFKKSIAENSKRETEENEKKRIQKMYEENLLATTMAANKSTEVADKAILYSKWSLVASIAAVIVAALPMVLKKCA